MKKELDYFQIENEYGGNQDWFRDPMMKLGGCAAATACDSSIYLDLYCGTGNLYPYAKNCITKADYVQFAQIMKPYLRPRWRGIDRLDIYLEGFGRYLADRKPNRKVTMEVLEGDREEVEARTAVIHQIDRELPIPCLILHHKAACMKEYVWHWFLLTGYEQRNGQFFVRAATYGAYEWLEFTVMWDTGYEDKGGLVLYGLG